MIRLIFFSTFFDLFVCALLFYSDKQIFVSNFNTIFVWHKKNYIFYVSIKKIILPIITHYDKLHTQENEL